MHRRPCADREPRLERLAVEVLTAVDERECVVHDAERCAGEHCGLGLPVGPATVDWSAEHHRRKGNPASPCCRDLPGPRRPMSPRCVNAVGAGGAAPGSNLLLHCGAGSRRCSSPSPGTSRHVPVAESLEPVMRTSCSARRAVQPRRKTRGRYLLGDDADEARTRTITVLEASRARSDMQRPRAVLDLARLSSPWLA
jgi:hypothetical protein